MISTRSAASARTRNRVLAAIDAGCRSVGEVMRRTRLSRSRVAWALVALRAGRVVVLAGDRRFGRWARTASEAKAASKQARAFASGPVRTDDGRRRGKVLRDNQREARCRRASKS